VASWEVPPKKRPFRGSKRLIRIESKYYYDPFGRRLWKEVNGTRTYFVYADEGLVAEVDAAGNVTKSYGYRPGSTWTTDPLFMKQGSEYYFYQNDHLGTPQKLTAMNGAVVWSAKYSSFGQADVDPSSTIMNNLRFPGQYFDQEIGQHYNYFRYYDPSIGRYNNLDPIGFAGLDKNLYSYTRNNPNKFKDPLGLTTEVGGGFGVNFAVVSVEASVSTVSCCDDKGKLHKRTISSFCVGFEIGFAIGSGSGPGAASLSFNNTPGKCPKTKPWEPDIYRTENNSFGFSSGIVAGAAWDSGNPTVTKIIAKLGMSFHIYSGCSNKIEQDKIVGCCSK